MNPATPVTPADAVEGVGCGWDGPAQPLADDDRLEVVFAARGPVADPLVFDAAEAALPELLTAAWDEVVGVLLLVGAGQLVVARDVVGVRDDDGEVEADRLVVVVDGAGDDAGWVWVGVADVVLVGDGCDDGRGGNSGTDGAGLGCAVRGPLGGCELCGAVGVGLCDGPGASGGSGNGPGFRPAYSAAYANTRRT